MQIKYKQSSLSAAVIMACSVLSSQAQAALTSGAVLNFNDGEKTTVTLPGTTFKYKTTTGSYFGMDSDGGGVSDAEKVAMVRKAGLELGVIQASSGQSHSGVPDGTENTVIDKAWNFFGNTGMHNSTAAITVASGGTTSTPTLDMSGWAVDWNGIEDIPMGGDKANFASDTGIATMTCYDNSTDLNAQTCVDGSYFVLNYAAHVPLGDSSGFGGVPYTLYLEGSVSILLPSLIGAGSLNDGDYGGTAATLYKATTALPEDSGYTASGSTFDFKIDCGSAGCSESIRLPLSGTIPAGAVLRKYSPSSGWVNFTEDGSNTIKSAKRAGTDCSGVAAGTFTDGLTEGDDCILLTMVDGGSNDSDGAADNIITDPSVLATVDPTFVDTRTWGTGGCSMSETPVNASERADWWLVAGFLGLLGWLRLYRRRSINQG
ncbi:MAG TPA: hypothetical protein ENI98_09265 [Gammaproteobacteria bacterium]|nr:hypothetical protein [Gammaproteobacteria bacterium]